MHRHTDRVMAHSKPRMQSFLDDYISQERTEQAVEPGLPEAPDIQHADKLANDLRCRLLVGRYDYIARFLSLSEHQNRYHGKELIFE